jgi:hypothetical protein
MECAFGITGQLAILSSPAMQVTLLMAKSIYHQARTLSCWHPTNLLADPSSR